MKNILVAPSILSADFANLYSDIRIVEDNGADLLHIDVMDGHFVPNISIGIPVVQSVKKISRIPLDVHLMIENPEFFVNQFIDAGANILTFHYEATNNPKDLLINIKKRNVKAGISIKPNTPSCVLDNLYDYIDLILVMSVEPGFGGQSFIPECAEKISYYKSKNIKNLLLEVDGGINNITAKTAISKGADILVAGNYIYKSKDIKKAITSIKEL